MTAKQRQYGVKLDFVGSDRAIPRNGKQRGEGSRRGVRLHFVDIGTAVATGASLGSGVVQGYSLDGNRSQLVSQTATTSGTQSMNRAYGALHRVLMWVGSSEITRLHNDFTRVLYCWSFGVVDCADI